MTQKAMIKLTMISNEREFSFEMPIGSPFGEAYDAAFSFLQEISTMAKEAADKAKREENKIEKE